MEAARLIEKASKLNTFLAVGKRALEKTKNIKKLNISPDNVQSIVNEICRRINDFLMMFTEETPNRIREITNSIMNNASKIYFNPRIQASNPDDPLGQIETPIMFIVKVQKDINKLTNMLEN